MMARRSPTQAARHLRTRVTGILVGLLMCMAGTVAAPAASEDTPIDLQLLSLTDLHGYLSDGENLAINGPDGRLQVGGAGYLKAHIDRLAAEADHSLLIGSGDQFSGWPDYTQAFANEPTIEVLNALGMDFDVAGNHEFDRELPFPEQMVSGSCDGKPGVKSCFLDSTGRTFHGTDYRYHAADIRSYRGTWDLYANTTWPARYTLAPWWRCPRRRSGGNGSRPVRTGESRGERGCWRTVGKPGVTWVNDQRP